MKRFELCVVLAFVFLSFATVGDSRGQTGDHVDASIIRTLADYDTAWNKKDVGAVSQILANDYVYFSSTGGLTDRKATVTFLASPDYILTFANRTEIRILSKTAAVSVLSSRWKGRGRYGKEEINDDQRCGLVFVRLGKVWKLISEHCVQIVGN
ncbi:MAG: nuclear transport factor 2 family protein [Pyrinomonadaceae bacterium]